MYLPRFGHEWRNMPNARRRGKGGRGGDDKGNRAGQKLSAFRIRSWQASPMAHPAWLTPGAAGVTVSLKVQPRASRSEVSGVVGSQLKVKVTAPPVDAAANQAVVELIAERVGCSRGAVQILRGQTSRNKVLLIHGAAADAVARALQTD